MNDFEMRRELRELRNEHQPQRDLWPQIARQIAAEGRAAEGRASAAIGRKPWLSLAAAASIALAVSGGIFTLAMQRHAGVVDADVARQPSGPSVREQIDRAHQLAATGDPRLASAEVVIDAASEELEHALQQQPDAVFLVGLINRTHAQRRKLARLGLDAG